MKYIRTKDGIEQVSYGEDFYEGKSYFYKTKYQWVYGDTYHKVKVKTYAKNGITKIANTIEDLFDEFVGIKENKKPIVQSSYTRLKPSLYILKNNLDIKEIYGAIWTDKGLIYVAKMHDKGVLELL